MRLRAPMRPMMAARPAIAVTVCRIASVSRAVSPSTSGNPNIPAPAEATTTIDAHIVRERYHGLGVSIIISPVQVLGELASTQNEAAAGRNPGAGTRADLPDVDFDGSGPYREIRLDRPGCIGPFGSGRLDGPHQHLPRREDVDA